MTWLWRWGAVCLLAGCGSKSGLFDGRSPSPDAGFAGSGGGGSGGGDAGFDAPISPPAKPCFLSVAGEPLEVLSFPEGEVGWVDLERVDDAHVGYLALSEQANFWHPEFRIAELSVDGDWPEGVSTSHAPVLFGFDAHNGGVMTSGVTNGTLALAFYHADEASPNVIPALKFRSFDTGKWNPGAEITIDEDGVSAHQIVAGPNGYAIAYRWASKDGGTWAPRIARVDAQGKLLSEPVAVAPEAPYPGASATVAWSGSHYLAAANVEGAIVVGRVDESGSTETASLSLASPSHEARRPEMAHWGEVTWVSWREALADVDDPTWSVKLAGLHADGTLALGPLLLAEEVRPVNGVALHASDIGVIVSWAEVADDDGPPHALGHSQLVFHHLSDVGEPIQPPFSLAVTQLAYDPAHAMTTLTGPRRLMVGWAGTPLGSEAPAVGWLARFDCSE